MKWSIGDASKYPPCKSRNAYVRARIEAAKLWWSLKPAWLQIKEMKLLYHSTPSPLCSKALIVDQPVLTLIQEYFSGTTEMLSKHCQYLCSIKIFSPITQVKVC